MLHHFDYLTVPAGRGQAGAAFHLLVCAGGCTGSLRLDCFKLLISVNGVGPKAALAILSELSADRLAVCIAGGDAKSLTRAPGIGKKIAERIVLELKDKMGYMFSEQQQEKLNACILFWKDLVESDKNLKRLTRIKIIKKHVKNGDFENYFNGKKGAIREFFVALFL